MSKKDWSYITVSPNVKVKVDSEDVERIGKHSWRATKGTQGRMRIVTSIRTKAGVTTLTLGKFLMKPPKGKQVYPRRFNDGPDYRKGNLIICTVQERQRMLPKNRKGASSGYRGVSYSRMDGKWRAAIEVDGRAINLGHYESETEAALAYNDAARKHFGEIAYQNPVGKKFIRRRED